MCGNASARKLLLIASVDRRRHLTLDAGLSLGAWSLTLPSFSILIIYQDLRVSICVYALMPALSLSPAPLLRERDAIRPPTSSASSPIALLRPPFVLQPQAYLRLSVDTKDPPSTSLSLSQRPLPTLLQCVQGLSASRLPFRFSSLAFDIKSRLRPRDSLSASRRTTDALRTSLRR